MIQVSIAGCAHIHTPNFVERLSKRTDVRVKTIWDPAPERAGRHAEKLGAATVASPELTWADPEVAAVIVCSETNRHADLVLPAALAGKHLFVEKPLGFASADAFQIAAAIEAAGVLFQTGYFMRSDPVNRFLKAEIGKGTFGRITRARFANCHMGALKGWFDTEWRWMADPAVAGCGAYGDLGTHALDLALWMLGDVESATAVIGSAIDRYAGCDEFGEGLLAFRGGAVAALAASWVDTGNPVSLQLAGTEGWALVRDGRLFVQSANLPGADGKEPWTDLPPALPHAFELFLDAVVGKPDVELVGAREAAGRSAVMEALYAGAARRAWVSPATA
jgi:predicted dehydrogenase